MSYHLGEDRAIEESMLARDESRADALTQGSYERAVERYRETGGLVFQHLTPNHPGEVWGEKLVRHLEKAEGELRAGRIRLDFLGSLHKNLLVQSFRLPPDIRFSTYKLAPDKGDSDEPGYDWEVEWTQTEESELRARIVNDIYEYCLTAAAIAKNAGLTAIQGDFATILATIETECMSGVFDADADALMDTERATAIVERISAANNMLWAELKIAVRAGELEREKPEALLEKAINGTIRRLNSVENTIELTKAAAAIPLPVMKDAPTQTSDQAPAPQTQPVKLGKWARKIIRNADAATRSIWLKRRKEPLVFSLNADAPWNLLVRMMTSTDPEGWIELSDYEARSWRPTFLHYSKDPLTSHEKSLWAIFRYIAGRNAPGQKQAVLIHLCTPKAKNRTKKAR